MASEDKLGKDFADLYASSDLAKYAPHFWGISHTQPCLCA